MNLSRALKTQCQKCKITVEHKAFADLIALGWNARDAYIAIGLAKTSLTDDYNERQMDKIISEENFQSYYATVQRTITKKLKKNAEREQTENANDDNFDPSSKESIIEHLTRCYQEATDTKQKADILTKIADLQRMKQDENLEEDQLVHYYMPIQCSICKLYEDARLKKETI